MIHYYLSGKSVLDEEKFMNLQDIEMDFKPQEL